MAVVDSLVVRKGSEFLPIDSLDNQMIDEIIYEGESFHFAKQKDLTGTSEIVAGNGVAEPIISLGVSGNTSQKQYQGYNLLNKEEFTNSALRNETQLSIHGNIVMSTEKVNTMLKPNTKYRMSFEVEGVSGIKDGGTIQVGQGFIFVAGATSNWLWIRSNEIANEGEVYNVRATFTTPADFYEKNYQLYVYTGTYIYENATYRATCIIRNVQIVEGADTKPYEPYVGGIPSPNPTYPQEIENANKEGMSITLHGDNLFNQEEMLTDSNFTKAEYNGEECIKVVANVNAHTFPCEIPIGKMSVSFEISHPKTGGNFSINLKYEDGSSEYREYSSNNLKTDFYKFSIAKTTTKKIVGIIITFWNIWNMRPYYIRNFMVNTGEPKPYEPYFREEIAIPTSVEVEGETVDLRFAKQGEKADKLIVDKTSGEVTYEQWVKTMNFPLASAGWNTTTTANQVRTIRLALNMSNYLSNLDYSQGYLLNKFKKVSDATLDEESFFQSSGWLAIRIDRNSLETQDGAGFYNWFKTQQDNGDPVLIHYALATPITHDLTNTDLGQSLLALATRKGTNYLEISSNLAPSQTDLSYWRQIIPNE